MAVSQEIIDRLLAAPSESLNVEIKRWINPLTVEGEAKIAIACLALRNRNGGFLVIGIDDKTLLPDDENRGGNSEVEFRPDVIQAIVSKYASIPFEVDVRLGYRDGAAYPIIVVPEGVTVPVASKKELIGSSSRRLIHQNGVYFRTLNSNGVASSSLAVHADWRDLVEICFENREADIGRFLRRHLGSVAADQLGIFRESEPSDTLLRKRAKSLLEDGERRRLTAFSAEKYKLLAKEYEGLGSWCVACVIDPPLPFEDSNQDFLRTLSSANPRYTGWPVWLDASGAGALSRPYKTDRSWETVLLSGPDGWGIHADFYRVHARGEFFMWRVLQDDLTDKVVSKTAFDLGLMVYRVVETIAVALAFAKALEVDERSKLAFAFRWQNIEGRKLSAWANPLQFISASGEAHDNVVEGYIVVPAETPATAIAPYVKEVTTALCGSFNGYDFPTQAIEQSVEKLITRSR